MANLTSKSGSSDSKLEALERQSAEAITLHIDDGILMAFGPDGDPVPPHLVKEVCAGDQGIGLRLQDGALVNGQRVLAVLDAQQRGPLSHRKSNRWIASFLGVEGGFEPTPAELLEQEPESSVPSPLSPDDLRAAPR